MAGAGYKLFNTGDVLTAAQVNTYLQEQAVMRFANATARTTALSGVLAEGMMSYLDDTNSVEVYNGSAWVSVGSTGDITGVTAGTGISGGGTSGDVTITNSMATEITAAGDIIVGTGSGTFDNLPIGTTGQVLTADTTVSPYKVKWASASSGGANWTLLNAGGTALTGAQTVTISGISGADKIMILVNGASSANASAWITARLNGDTAANYYAVFNFTTAGSTYSVDNMGGGVDWPDYAVLLGKIRNDAGGGAAYGITFTGCNSSGVKAFAGVGGGYNNNAYNSWVQRSCQGYYNSSSVISSVSVWSSTGNLDAGTVYVYTSA